MKILTLTVVIAFAIISLKATTMLVTYGAITGALLTFILYLVIGE